MKVHHLNCGTLYPDVSIGELNLWQSGSVTTVCHCLFIEPTKAGLVLVDTGLGIDDVGEFLAARRGSV